MTLQTAFQQHLLDAGNDFVDHIAPGGRIDAERRLNIYHHAYRARLVEALRDTYSHTAAWLGEDWFDADALVYVEAHPSGHPNLNAYGEGFASWLSQRWPQDGEIGELAQLDWALRRAFDGPNAPVLQLANLAALTPEDWGQVGFVLHPTARRLRFMHNTLSLWHAMDQDQEPPPATRLDSPCEVLTWRHGHDPHFRSLGLLEQSALMLLTEGASFAGMCEQLAQDFAAANVAVEAGSLLRRWVEDGLLSSLSPAPVHAR